MLPQVIIAENDPATQCVLEMTLRQRVQCDVKAVRYGYELIDELNKQPDVDLVITDMRLPDMSGLEVINEMQRQHKHIPIVVAASVRDDKLVKPALEQGAVEYVRKTDPPNRIAALVKSVLVGEVSKLSRPSDANDSTPRDAFEDLVGSSSAMQTAIESARQAAASDIPVILKGESGVGKERFAQAIHAGSSRASGPFVAVNCGAIPANLVESTLFGHQKGAFTGATSAAPGKFREAEDGTLFLDEVGELPLDIQVKLLRALQEKEVQPVGGGKPVPVDIRVISATHVDLEHAISTGHFREDLYYRLHVFPIDIPPLRVRGRRDIEALIKHFTKRFAQQEDKVISKVSDAAIGLLIGYNWPGNIRQLENAIYRAVVMTKSEMLKVEDFVLVSNALHQRQLEERKAEAAPQVQNALTPKNDKKQTITLTDADGEFKSMREIEGEVLFKALTFYRWHITNISRALGLTRATIYKKMKAAGIEDPRERTGETL